MFPYDETNKFPENVTKIMVYKYVFIFIAKWDKNAYKQIENECYEYCNWDTNKVLWEYKL